MYINLYIHIPSHTLRTQQLQNTISESQLALQASKDLAEELNTKVSAKNGVIEDLLSKLEGA